MRYTQLSSEHYIANRKRFASQLQRGALAIFCSNDIYPTSADGHMPFKQASDIFYLSGVDQEESILVIFPDAFNAAQKEILFLKETSEHIAIWEGAKLTKEQARAQTGIQNIQWVKDFEKIIHVLLNEVSCVYLNNNEHTRAHIEVETREMRFSKWFRSTYPHYRVERAAPIMHALRAVKDNAEVVQLQRAVNITRSGFERVLKMLKPGVMEYEIEAEYAHEFLRNGSRGFAYTPIIASGLSACVLHYIDNDKPCKDGDVILMDVGAEYGNYNADMTRCAPVSGKFTPRQKDVYNAVLRVMKGATALLKPGIYLQDYHVQVGELMTKELVDLKLISMDDVKAAPKDWPAYKKYFMHGTSHYLGLDTHDVGPWNEPIKANMVFTCEPGIYIPEEGLGIRIEDDLVVQASGEPFNLMKNIPIEVDEIESLMNA